MDLSFSSFLASIKCEALQDKLEKAGFDMDFLMETEEADLKDTLQQSEIGAAFIAKIMKGVKNLKTNSETSQKISTSETSSSSASFSPVADFSRDGQGESSIEDVISVNTSVANTPTGSLTPEEHSNELFSFSLSGEDEAALLKEMEQEKQYQMNGLQTELKQQPLKILIKICSKFDSALDFEAKTDCIEYLISKPIEIVKQYLAAELKQTAEASEVKQSSNSNGLTEAQEELLEVKQEQHLLNLEKQKLSKIIQVAQRFHALMNEFVSKTYLTSMSQMNPTLDETTQKYEDTFLKHLSEFMNEKLLKREQVVICVLGLMKSGKSTLLNYLIGANICPTFDTACTAQPTIIRSGKQLKLMIQQQDNIIANHNFNTIAEMSSFLAKHTQAYRKQMPTQQQQQQPSQSQAEVLTSSDTTIIIEYPDSILLNSGIQFVDLPGVGENSELDSIVKQFVTKVDMVLHVYNLANDWTQNDVQALNWFIDNNLHERKQAPVFIVGTRYDQWIKGIEGEKDGEAIISSLRKHYLSMQEKNGFEYGNKLEDSKFFKWVSMDRTNQQYKSMRVNLVKMITKTATQMMRKVEESTLDVLSDYCMRVFSMFDANIIETNTTPSFDKFISSIKKLMHDFEKTRVAPTLKLILQNEKEEIEQYLLDIKLSETILRKQSNIRFEYTRIMLSQICLRLSRKLSTFLQELQQKFLEQIRIMENSFIGKDDSLSRILKLFTEIKGTDVYVGFFSNPLRFIANLWQKMRTGCTDKFQSLTKENLIKDIWKTNLSLSSLMDRISAQSQYYCNELKEFIDLELHNRRMMFCIANYFSQKSRDVKRRLKNSAVEIWIHWLLIKDIKEENVYTINFSKILGKGNCHVYEGTCNGFPVAVKIIPVSERYSFNEIFQFSQLSNAKNCIKFFTCKMPTKAKYPQLKDVELPDQFFELYIEKADCSLANRMGSISIYEVLEVIYDIALALEELHEKGLFHRDIKPQNILLIQHKAHLGDLATVTFNNQPDGSRTIVGSRDYMAPEVFNEHYDSKADIFSFGKVIGEMRSYLDINLQQNPSTLFVKTLEAVELLSQNCMDQNPFKRPTAKMIKESIMIIMCQSVGATLSSTANTIFRWNQSVYINTSASITRSEFIKLMDNRNDIRELVICTHVDHLDKLNHFFRFSTVHELSSFSNTNSDKEIIDLGMNHSTPISSIITLPTTSIVVSVSHDGQIVVRNIATKTITQSFKLEGKAFPMTLIPVSNSRFLCQTGRMHLYLFDLRQCKNVQSFNCEVSAKIVQVTVMNTSQVALLLHRQTSHFVVKIWNVDINREVSQITYHESFLPLHCSMISLQSSKIVLTGQKVKLLVWSVNQQQYQGQQQPQLQQVQHFSVGGPFESAVILSVHKLSSSTLGIVMSDTSIRIWKSETRQMTKLLLTMDGETPLATPDSSEVIEQMFITPDNHLVVLSTGYIRLIHISTKTVILKTTNMMKRFNPEYYFVNNRFILSDRGYVFDLGTGAYSQIPGNYCCATIVDQSTVVLATTDMKLALFELRQ